MKDFFSVMFIYRSTRNEQIDQESAQQTEEEEGAEVVALEVVSTILMPVTCPDHVVEQCSGQSCLLYRVVEVTILIWLSVQLWICAYLE